MRVVAARFAGKQEACAALDVLTRELQPPEVAVAPLAHLGEPVAEEAVLAGRFEEEQARVAKELVVRAGGEIVADIDERWIGLNNTSYASGRARATRGGDGWYSYN